MNTYKFDIFLFAAIEIEATDETTARTKLEDIQSSSPSDAEVAGLREMSLCKEGVVEEPHLYEVNGAPTNPSDDELLTAMEDLFRHCAMTHKHWGDGCNQKQADAAIKHAEALIAKRRAS